jgi:hypothetical protein
MVEKMKTQDIIQKFQKAVERGTGDAYFIIKNNPSVDFSTLILKAATKCYGYDVQSEGRRAVYIYNIINIIPQKEAIIAEILKRLSHKKTDDYALDQLCDLAVLFYKNGNTSAKQILYARFEKSILPSFDVCGEDQIIALGGWDGFLHYAIMMGRIMIHYKENMDIAWRVTNFQTKNPDINVRAELQKRSTDNEYIAAFLKEIIETEAADTEGKPTETAKKSNFDTIQHLIAQDKYRYIPYFKTNSLSQNEVEILANDFLKTNSTEKQLMYLCIFSHIKYPFADYQPLLKFAKSKKIKNPRSIEFACSALSHIQADDIRALALHKIKTVRNPSEYLVLLESNYKNGDEKTLIEVLERSDNYHYIHTVACAIIDIFEKNNTPNCKIPLEIIYSKMNCGIHRHTLLEILHRNKVLSDTIQQEMLFDSDSDIRDAAISWAFAK